jgi:hypothetical protein
MLLSGKSSTEKQETKASRGIVAGCQIARAHPYSGLVRAEQDTPADDSAHASGPEVCF